MWSICNRCLSITLNSNAAGVINSVQQETQFVLLDKLIYCLLCSLPVAVVIDNQNAFGLQTREQVD